MQNEREKLMSLFDSVGPLSGKDVLRCIEIARDAMLRGECSVEAYYFAKKVLISEVETASLWIN